MTALTLILVAFIIGVAWHSGLRARERANEVAMETCRQTNVQFLDGTVAFSSMRPARDAGGNFSWRRTYTFDYTEDGVSRHQGFVVLVGPVVETVGLAPGRGNVH